VTFFQVNLVESCKEIRAKCGEQISGHFFSDSKSDHVDRVQQLEGQHLTLLPAAGKYDVRIGDQLEN
jgi:hypothetical protein